MAKTYHYSALALYGKQNEMKHLHFEILLLFVCGLRIAFLFIVLVSR